MQRGSPQPSSGDLDLSNENDPRADRLVGGSGAGIPGCEREIVLHSRESDEGVVDRPAGDLELTEELREAGLRSGRKEKRSSKPSGEQAGRIRRKEAKIAGKPRENRVRLGERVSGERDLTSVPPVHDVWVRLVCPHEQRDGDACVESDPD